MCFLRILRHAIDLQVRSIRPITIMGVIEVSSLGDGQLNCLTDKSSLHNTYLLHF
ncbi:hypothetical protein WN55_02938 [Dufourea novaeangliae]|uniref:Uncharacterized protein n=1 Tax=Dufourea novaeangliae TaxID=178035 RepID=A0A154PIF9_DUFNO|nr:hypothetical protein WN55_02938 [Dufourea novaeangliae]